MQHSLRGSAFGSLQSFVGGRGPADGEPRGEGTLRRRRALRQDVVVFHVKQGGPWRGSVGRGHAAVSRREGGQTTISIALSSRFRTPGGPLPMLESGAVNDRRKGS